MTLTVGTGPFGHRPGGRFDFDPPERIVYVEEFPRRVRGIVGGETIINSDRVKLVHRSGRLPHYAFPAADVRLDAAKTEPAVEGHVRVEWDAIDEWYEEDEQVFVHVRDPYHRIDVVPTSRHVRVSLDGALIAKSRSPLALYETSLPTRWYFGRNEVRPEVLAPSRLRTECAYKGQAQHHGVRIGERVEPHLGWSYDDVLYREGEPIRGRIAFYNERVDVDVDGVRQERPRTPWSDPEFSTWGVVMNLD